MAQWPNCLTVKGDSPPSYDTDLEGGTECASTGWLQHIFRPCIKVHGYLRVRCSNISQSSDKCHSHNVIGGFSDQRDSHPVWMTQ